MKKLNDFEMSCILTMLGDDISPQMDGLLGLPEATWRRLRSRVRRFVLTHPDVTPKQRRLFNRAARGVK